MFSGLLLACGANAVSAQSYPTNTIRLVVPYSAGGGADFVARIYAEGLSKSLNQQVIVDNRAGANGNIGAELVAKAKPDGYTLLLTASSSLTINPALYKNLPFSAQEDFEPVGIVAVQPNILVVHPTLPVRSVKELVEYAKAHPGKLNFASAGVGSSGHLSGELFKSVAGVQMVHVPYKGTAPATNDLIAGQVLTMFNNLPPSLALIKDGKLRPLAVTGPKRSPTASEVPTMAEAGYPDVEVIVWNAVLAPAGTPTEIVEKLSAQLIKLSKQPDIQKRLEQQGVEPSSEGPKELAKRLRDETLRWEKVARSAGIPKE
jgi:tripartite-type tricarboxylate transporter receptor subunit TctC